MKRRSQMELISVIIAVYNTEKYLCQCLDSVVNQTYTNLEIILVDDGSTDGSSEICKQYAQQDQRVQYIRQNNSGVSAARNNGLHVATGEYVYFADSDDFFELNMLEILYRLAHEHHAQIAACHWKSEFDDSTAQLGEKQWDYPKSVELFSAEEAMISLLQFKSYLGFGWNKLFEMRLLRENHIEFDESLKMLEDELLCCLAIERTERVVYTNLKLYHYRLTGMSSTRGKNFNPNMLQRVSAIDKIEAVSKRFDSEEVINAFYDRRMIVDIEAKKYLTRYHMHSVPEWKLCKKRIRKHLFAYLKQKDNYGGKRYKIQAIAFALF